MVAAPYSRLWLEAIVLYPPAINLRVNAIQPDTSIVGSSGVKTRAMITQFAFERERSIYILHFFQPQRYLYKMFHLRRCQHKILQLDKWQYERSILLQVTHIMLATLQIVTMLLKRGSLGNVYFFGRVALL